MIGRVVDTGIQSVTAGLQCDQTLKRKMSFYGARSSIFTGQKSIKNSISLILL